MATHEGCDCNIKICNGSGPPAIRAFADPSSKATAFTSITTASEQLRGTEEEMLPLDHQISLQDRTMAEERLVANEGTVHTQNADTELNVANGQSDRPDTGVTVINPSSAENIGTE